MRTFAVFYLLKNRGSNWVFASSDHKCVEDAEKHAVSIMDEYGDDVNQIKVLEEHYSGKPRATKAVVWTRF